MPTMPGLTDPAIRQVKPEPRPWNRYDTLGLYLTIAPTGAKWWRLKYLQAKNDAWAWVPIPRSHLKRRVIGVITPAPSSEMAGTGADRRAARSRARTAAANTFQAAAEIWLEERRPRLAESTIDVEAPGKLIASRHPLPRSGCR